MDKQNIQSDIKMFIVSTSVLSDLFIWEKKIYTELYGKHTNRYYVNVNP